MLKKHSQPEINLSSFKKQPKYSESEMMNRIEKLKSQNKLFMLEKGQKYYSLIEYWTKHKYAAVLKKYKHYKKDKESIVAKLSLTLTPNEIKLEQATQKVRKHRQPQQKENVKKTPIKTIVMLDGDDSEESKSEVDDFSKSPEVIPVASDIVK